MDFDENVFDVFGQVPFGVVRFELGNVADPPDVIADAVIFRVTGIHFAAGDFFAQHNCFLHGTVAETAAAHVAGFAAAGSLIEMPECLAMTKKY